MYTNFMVVFLPYFALRTVMHSWSSLTMADKPQEYITPTGKVTTNSVEGFHGLALKYRGKRIDLGPAHYCCKTNMAVLPQESMEAYLSL